MSLKIEFLIKFGNLWILSWLWQSKYVFSYEIENITVSSNILHVFIYYLQIIWFNYF